MKPQLSDERTLAEQAQEWIRHPPANDAGAQAAFAVWLKRSPQHVQCYLQMLAVEREFLGIDSGREIDVDTLIARAHDNVVPLNPVTPGRADRTTPARSHHRMLAASIALLSVGAAAAIAVWLSANSSQTYRTDTGQQQKIKLPDGTMIELNTESRLQARFSADGRDVYLLAGEALFDIHPDARPFRVHAGGTVIEDIGTRFNVYRRQNSLTVSVIEGEVEISGAAPEPTRVVEGEEAQIGAEGQALAHGKTDVARATAWRQRRLWFQGTPLGEIAAEFNRYNTAPKILVEEEALRLRRFSGVFNADDPKSFVQFLYQDAGIDFDHDQRGFVVRSRD